MEGTYEYELERAELLGIEPLDRAKWQEQNKARLEAQVEEEQAEIARELEGEDETLRNTRGKMEELNSILSATQMKINKFKVIYFRFCVFLKRSSISSLDCLRKFHEFVENKIRKRKSSSVGRPLIDIKRQRGSIDVNQQRVRYLRSTEGSRTAVRSSVR